MPLPEVARNLEETSAIEADRHDYTTSAAQRQLSLVTG